MVIFDTEGINNSEWLMILLIRQDLGLGDEKKIEENIIEMLQHIRTYGDEKIPTTFQSYIDFLPQIKRMVDT